LRKLILAMAALVVAGMAPQDTQAQAQAKADDPLEGVWQGYDGELRHVERQLIALAEAIPEDKFNWRPTPGVRSTSEVYMHIVTANFYLLSVTGPKIPDDMKEGIDTSVTSKAEVIKWLK